MKSKKKVGFIILIVTLVIVVVLPAVGYGILRWGVLPPHKLTPLVVNEVNKYINGRLECESIELTYFETYPRLGVKMTNGRLISYAARDSAALANDTVLLSDSLLWFSRALVSVNPTDYLFNNKITIPAILIEYLDFHGYVNEAGGANWDIYQEEEEEIAGDTIKKPLPKIDLQRVRVKAASFVYDDRQADMYTQLDSLFLKLDASLMQGGSNVDIHIATPSLVYDDRQNDTYAEVEGFFLKINGSLSRAKKLLDLEAGSSSIYFANPSYTLNNKLELDLKSKIELSDRFNTVRLEDARLMVNNFPFTADGIVQNQPDSNRMYVDMAMGLQVSDMNELLKFVPDIYFQNRSKINAKGEIKVEADVKGFVGDSIAPIINLCCKVENGSYHMKGVKQGIDLFELDMDMHLNGPKPDSSFVVLEKLRVEGLNTSFNLTGKALDIFRSPTIDAYMKGTVDFTRLAEEFLNPDTLFLRGKMDADMSAKFLVDDLLDGAYNRIQAGGNLQLDRFQVRSKSSGLRMFLTNARFTVDSTKQTSSYITNEDLIAAYLTVDSLSVRYKDQINTRLKGLDIQAKTTPSIDTTAVIPVTTHIKVENITTRLPDSVWVTAKNTYLRGGIKPSESNKQVPVLGASITVDTLRYIDVPLRTGTSLAGNTFNLEALPYRDAIRQRQRQRQQQQEQAGVAAEQPRRRNTQNANRARRNATAGQSRTDSASNTGGFLRNWEVRGSLKFEQMRMFSRLFPLPMRMDKTTLRFDTDKITLTDAHFHAGKSNFLLNGEIKSIRRAMLRGGKLTANLNLNSDYIDCNQLLQAMNRGMMYAEENFTEADAEAMSEGSISEMDTSLGEISVEDTDEGLFIVPAFLDMNLYTKAKRIDYNELELENIEGEMVIRNQTLNLKRLTMDSNIGKGGVTMVYTTKDKYEATAGFELDFDNILVNRLIGLFPSIDTLLPMLRSFEGVVDCQMAATCKLDSTMSVVLPSLNSSCYMRGENMVLLDGETFSEISKTLMFKNKQRNVIDSISVDLAIRENKIEVYPFLLEMDRYRVAVGGTHNLDMTFNYHLSVLKSPVPFKLGIDITGNIDKFKYKITKCKYKDIFKPAKEGELNATRTNLRTEIREMIRNQIRENAPELNQDDLFRPERRQNLLIEEEG